MPDQKTIDLIGYVHTSNKSKMYEKNKELETQAQENKKLLRQSTKLGLDMAIELIDLRNKLKENNSARDNGLGLSKETQDKMVEFVNNNSKATLQDVIKEFFSK